MTSGLTAFPTFGADRKPAPRFSAAVIRYLVALPVLTPAGILITQRKTRVELFQPHALSAGFLIPGPVRETWTRSPGPRRSPSARDQFGGRDEGVPVIPPELTPVRSAPVRSARSRLAPRRLTCGPTM